MRVAGATLVDSWLMLSGSTDRRIGRQMEGEIRVMVCRGRRQSSLVCQMGNLQVGSRKLGS